MQNAECKSRLLHSSFFIFIFHFSFHFLTPARPARADARAPAGPGSADNTGSPSKWNSRGTSPEIRASAIFRMVTAGLRSSVPANSRGTDAISCSRDGRFHRDQVQQPVVEPRAGGHDRAVPPLRAVRDREHERLMLRHDGLNRHTARAGTVGEQLARNDARVAAKAAPAMIPAELGGDVRVEAHACDVEEDVPGYLPHVDAPLGHAERVAQRRRRARAECRGRGRARCRIPPARLPGRLHRTRARCRPR